MRSLYSFMYSLFMAVVTNEEVDPNDFIQFRAVEEAAKALKRSKAEVFGIGRANIVAVSPALLGSDSEEIFPETQIIDLNMMKKEAVQQFIKDLKQLEEDVEESVAKEAVSAVRKILEGSGESVPKYAVPLATAIAYAGSALASSIVVPLFNLNEPVRSAALTLSPLVPNVLMESDKAHAVAYPICHHVDLFDKKMKTLESGPFYGLISIASADTVKALENIITQMEITVGNPKNPACGVLSAPSKLKGGSYVIAFSAAPLYLTDEQVKRLSRYLKTQH